MCSCGKNHHNKHSDHKFKVVMLKEGDKLLVVCKEDKKRKNNKKNKKHHR